jgi:hypothetical protein
VPDDEGDRGVSALEDERGRGAARDTVAGFMAAASLFLSLLALAERPGRLAPVAALIAIVAGRMSRRFERLALWAAIAAALAWVLGMTFAVITENPIV